MLTPGARLDRLGPGAPPGASLRVTTVVHAVHQLGQALGELRVPTTTLLCGLGVVLVWRRPRLAMSLACTGSLIGVVATFPATPNHVFLGVVVSLLLALLDGSSVDEAFQLRRSLVALPLLAFFHSGVAKLAHGAWFRGQTLAFLVTVRADVRAALAPFLAPEELARLAALAPVVGAGPFRLTGFLLAASNAVWLAELVLPVALLAVPVLAARAGWLLPAAVIGIQLVAHEWTFGLLLLTLTLPLVRERWLRAWAVGLMALSGVLLMLHWRLLPAPPWLMPTLIVPVGLR